MNITAKLHKNIETNNDKTVNLGNNPDEMVLQNVNMPFSGVMNEMSAEKTEGLSLIESDFNFDSLSMTLEDAMFFINLAQDGQFTVNNNAGEFQNLIQTEVAQNVISQKTVEVTNQLTTLIEKAQNTQKPIRLSFDNDVSVILKIDKNGKITAEFIPGSIEVENYLRNNIASLKQKFDEQNLPYNDLLYRQNSKQNKNKKNRGDN